MKKITLLLLLMFTVTLTFAQVVISENFDAGTPAGWTDSYGNTTSQTCSGNSERDNLYSGSATGNMTSPNQVASSNATDLTISFDYKVVDWSAATVATAAGWGTAELQYSTDDGATWTTVLTIDDTNHVAANTCATMTATVLAAALPAASDVKLQIANTWTAGDYYFYIDNFVASQVVSSAPVCPNNIVSTPDAACGNFDVPITWDASTGSLGYKISVGTSAGATDIENLTDIGNTLTYSIVGPVAGTTYYYTVLAYNGVGDSTGCTENTVATFATGCACTSVPSSNDGTGITNLQVGTTDFPSGGDITYEDFTGTPVDLGQGIASNIQIVFATGYTYGTNIWIDFNDDLTFDSATELVFSGVSAAPNPSTLDASFTMPATASLGAHLMRIGTADSGQATPNPCYNGSYGVTMDVDVNIIAVSCNPPTGMATLVTDCDNLQFYVDVDVTGLGDGTSTINDGTNTYPATILGVVQVGPYTDGSSITLVLENGTDSTCDLALGTFAYTCPPVGSLCSDPIVMASLPFNQAATTAGFGDDYSGSAGASCGSASSYLNGDDIVYAYTATADQDFTVSLSNITDNYTGCFVYSDCADIGTTCLAGAVNGFSTADISYTLSVNSGVTYYVVISTWASPQTTSFTLDVSSANLSTTDFESNSIFTYYPNPVNNTLTLNAQQAITSVAVFNMLGQEVIRTAPNAVSNEVNMSNLQSGAYFVQVTIGQRVETVRIIKN